MKNCFKLFLIIILFSSLFISCSDDPSSTGLGLLPGDDLVGMNVLDSDSTTINMTSSYFQDSLAVSGSDRILIGQTSTAKSYGLIKFYVIIPDSISTQVGKDSIVVRKCWVEINPNYLLGDNAQTFDFNIFKINQEWSAEDMDLTTFNSLSVDRGIDLSSNKSITDTLIKFQISSSLVNDWVLNGVDSLKGENHGVLFSSTNNTNRIIGFPALTSTASLTDFVVKIEIEKLGHYLDTLTASTTEDAHVVDYTVPNSTKNNLFLMGGAAYRSQMYFDLTTLPKNIVINKASLDVFIDSTESFIGSPSSDTVFAIILDDSTNHDINSYYDISYLFRSDKKYSGDITAFVQRWIDGLENQGLRLNISDEANSVNKIAIGGTKSTNYRPKLKIVYTKRQ